MKWLECLRSAVPLALRSNLIETITRLTGLFEKLRSLLRGIDLGARGAQAVLAVYEQHYG